MTADNVGFVVIGRNEGQRLIVCLNSLTPTQQSVVYVDSGSEDGSVDAAERLGAHVVSLDMSRPFTAARARNEGFLALKALKPGIEFVQFVDGDCEVVHGWLDKALAAMNIRQGIAVVCGRRRERYPNSTLYNNLCDIALRANDGETSESRKFSLTWA